MLTVTAEAVKIVAGAITRLKSLEWAKNIARNDEKTPYHREFLWCIKLTIDCETWH